MNCGMEEAEKTVMSNRKNNQNICDFYKNKNNDVLTLKYFEKCPPKESSNGYSKLYDDFCNENSLFENADNESLYRVIEAWENIETAKFPIEIFRINKEIKIHIRTIHCPSEMPDLDFLKNIGIDLLHPCQNQGKKANQKWHLFVGIFAYNVVCDKSFNWENNFIKYPCLVLRLWMIENAENQKDLKDIETAIDNGDLDLTKNLIHNAFNALLEEG